MKYRLDCNKPGFVSREFETAGEVVAAFLEIEDGWQVSVFKRVMPHFNAEVYYGMKGESNPPRVDDLIDAKYDSNKR